MLITLHCGGMPFDGTTIESKSLGGSESAAYYMAKELAALGHSVTLFTNTTEESFSDEVRYVPMGTSSEQYPLGETFHFFAENTPTDVMIIQRHPRAFDFPWASKINLWWIHDLALYRNTPVVNQMMWNIDGVLCVSEWHKKQVVEVYSLNPSIVYPITNGVDLSLFENDKKDCLKSGKSLGLNPETTALLYTSRPERGLEALVKPNGIVEKLYETDKNFHLYVCGYDNTVPQQRDYYNHLWSRCDALPNVTNLGSLTKQELADVMRQCDMHIYPSTFEETSCITAMECMAAGLPMVACKVGALPETVRNAGVILIDLLDDGSIDETGFEYAIANAIDCEAAPISLLDTLRDTQLSASEYYSWQFAADRMLSAVSNCFETSRVSDASVVKELIQMSDYYATGRMDHHFDTSSIDAAITKELRECYDFTKEPIWDNHYANYYQYEKDRGVNYGPEDLSNSHRFMHVANIISNLPAGSTVLDYGCAHGHYTINLAKAFPELNFIGIDITESNIEKAKAWWADVCSTMQEGADAGRRDNLKFRVGRVENGVITNRIEQKVGSSALAIEHNIADCIIAAEVLEHVSNPEEHVNTLQSYLKSDGLMLITTPYGPWEAQGFKEHWPWRAHVHHFEREDLSELWGSNENFKVVNVPSGRAPSGELLGSFITTWNNTGIKSGEIDYARKLSLVAPRQTVSCCMIVKDAASSIRRCLESVMPYVDELVIGFDERCDLETQFLVKHYIEDKWFEKSYIEFSIDSPLEIGFDAARNATAEKASGDWILWVDADEYLYNGKNLAKYLRNNQYNGYAIPQHHFSMQPLGVGKTDYPVRLFRSNKGIQFMGKVHEHPEQVLNEGVGHVTSIHNLSILHDGYTDEATRRKRFSRNVGLLTKDREENPERLLGKFLWLRDLAQVSQWELEDTRGRITQAIVNRVVEGLALWRELLENGDLRISIDALEYYSALSRMKGEGFEMSLQLDTSSHGTAKANEVRPVQAYFDSKEDAEKLMSLIFKERTKLYGVKYQ